MLADRPRNTKSCNVLASDAWLSSCPLSVETTADPMWKQRQTPCGNNGRPHQVHALMPCAWDPARGLEQTRFRSPSSIHTDTRNLMTRSVSKTRNR